jgi:hypothetical protein
LTNAGSGEHTAPDLKHCVGTPLLLAPAAAAGSLFSALGSAVSFAGASAGLFSATGASAGLPPPQAVKNAKQVKSPNEPRARSMRSS